MLRFLADENVPDAAVRALSEGGHDIVKTRNIRSGMEDAEVLDLAILENRILLTFDKDFGELARAKLKWAQVSGVILLRLPMRNPVEAAKRIALLINARSDWPGHFSVIEEDRIRMRRLE